MNKLVEVKNLRTYFFVEATDKQLVEEEIYKQEEKIKEQYNFLEFKKRVRDVIDRKANELWRRL